MYQTFFVQRPHHAQPEVGEKWHRHPPYQGIALRAYQITEQYSHECDLRPSKRPANKKIPVFLIYLPEKQESEQKDIEGQSSLLQIHMIRIPREGQTTVRLGQTNFPGTARSTVEALWPAHADPANSGEIPI